MPQMRRAGFRLGKAPRGTRARVLPQPRQADAMDLGSRNLGGTNPIFEGLASSHELIGPITRLTSLRKQGSAAFA
jgi:hypothetical protein